MENFSEGTQPLIVLEKSGANTKARKQRELQSLLDCLTLPSVILGINRSIKPYHVIASHNLQSPNLSALCFVPPTWHQQTTSRNVFYAYYHDNKLLASLFTP